MPDPQKQALERPSRRAKAILLSLRAGEPSAAEMFEAFSELDALPLDEVREALATIGPLPDPDRLDTATRLKHGLPLRRLRLRTISTAKDADVLDLGPMAEQQIQIAGTIWDGAERTPEERLDGEIDGSFAGTLERRVLADADAPALPLFDVLLFAEDSGIVFATGTTDVVALVAYGKVELRDRRTRVAIEAALAEEPSAANGAPESEGAPLAPAATPTERTEGKDPRRAPASKKKSAKTAGSKKASPRAPAKEKRAKPAAPAKTRAKKPTKASPSAGKSAQKVTKSSAKR